MNQSTRSRLINPLIIQHPTRHVVMIDIRVGAGVRVGGSIYPPFGNASHRPTTPMPAPCVLVHGTSATLAPNPISPYPPKPGPLEVLIRNVVVASNPKDWKLASVGAWVGHIEGNDVAGYVVQVGDQVDGVEVGDRVG